MRVPRAVVAGALVACLATPASGGPALAPAASASDDGCRPTHPNGRRPPGERRSSAHHGKNDLWVALHRRGELVVSRTVNDQGGGLQSDGSIRSKYPWWGSSRAGRRLTVTGVSLDAEAVRVRSTVNQHSRARAPRFWPTILRFPRAGCYRITGRAGESRLRFVTRVRFEDE